MVWELRYKRTSSLVCAVPDIANTMNENFEAARTLFVEGVNDFEAGRLDAAEAKFQASLALLPGRVSTLTNLAATQIKLARRDAALATLQEALAADPDNTDAWWHKGIALYELNRFEEALAAFERLLVLQPERCEAWVRHGQTLQELERLEQALSSYDKALAIDPSLALAWTQRGSVLKDQRRLDEAAHAFRQALAAGGDAEMLGYLLASVQTPVAGHQAPASAPARYVQKLFDEYADTFDVHLVQVLRYQAHVVLANHLDKLRDAAFPHALDLGCGTGLCGPLVHPFAPRIDGVDLSQKMLDKAEQLQVYDRLVRADIPAYLQTTDTHYDLVLAADVFAYMGDLDPVFGGAARVMAHDGMFCFSVETAERDQDFELKTSLRYGHSEVYVRRLAARHGFEALDILHLPIREDKQQPIQGLYVYLRKL